MKYIKLFEDIDFDIWDSEEYNNSKSVYVSIKEFIDHGGILKKGRKIYGGMSNGGYGLIGKYEEEITETVHIIIRKHNRQRISTSYTNGNDGNSYFIKVKADIVYEKVDFDNIDEEEEPEITTVIDIRGDKIELSEAVELNDGGYLHEDEAAYSEYHGYHIDPNDGDYLWIEGDGGDFISSDEVKYSEYHDKYYHPDEEDIVWVSHNGYEDFIEAESTTYSNMLGEYIHPNDDSVVYAERRDDYIEVEDSIYIEDHDEHAYMDDVVYIDSEEKYVYPNEAVYCEHDDEYIETNNAIELVDGTSTYGENAVKDINGDMRHINTVTWDDEKEVYVS